MKQFTLIIFCLFTLTIHAQLTDISPVDLEEGDLFGFIVDIDGDDLLFSAAGSDDLKENFGAIFHYRYDGSEWQLNQKILPTIAEIENSSSMGSWCSISGDWIAASIRRDDLVRSVVFYKRENNEWIRHSKITNNVEEGFFGWQIKLDGNQVIIGSINDFNDDGIRTGAAYIYDYNPIADEWQQAAKLAPEDLEFGDLFGGAVYMKDGLAAVASRNDNDNGANSGAVYIFEKDEGVWTQAAKITPDDGMPDDRFGYRIDGDDNKLIISGYGSNNETGAAYIYRFDNEWVQEARLDSEDLSEGDWFGSSIVLDGDRAIIGARHHTGNADRSGAFFIFEKEGMNWTEKHKFINPNGQVDDFLGGALDFENEQFIISSYGYNNRSGAAYTLNINDLVSTKSQLEPTFSIYPNPCRSHLKLDIEGQDMKEIDIFSVDGVWQRSFKYDGSTIDISQLNTGCYFLRSKVDALPLGKFVKI